MLRQNIIDNTIAMMLMKLFLIGFLCLLSACAAEKNSSPLDVKTEPTSAGQSRLTDSTWLLEELLNEQDQLTQPIAESAIDLSFNKQKLTGYAGCNSYFGQYQISDQHNLNLAGPIATSLKACSSEINQQERTYLNLLQKATHFRLENDQLILLDKNETALLTFSAQNPLQILESTNWQASGINNNRGGVVSDKNTHLSTAQFSDGKIQGKAACNQFSASYTLQNQTITIGPTRTTRMFCAEDGVMTQEAQFLYALTQVNRFEIQANRLYLRDASGSLWLSFKQLSAD